MEQKSYKRWISFLPLLPIIAIIMVAVYQKSVSANSWRDPVYSMPVTQEDGDTILTRQVACSSFSATIATTSVTLLSSTNTPAGVAWNIRQLRKRTFANLASGTALPVYIGTQTAQLSTLGYPLVGGEIPNWPNIYETHNSATFYCQQGGSSSLAYTTIYVIEEYNSIP